MSFPQLPILSSSRTGGTISLCQAQDCQHRCCDFATGNFIVLYPGEVEQARRNGEKLDHLILTADGREGHRAICRACDKATCDEGYKPLDCASYPLFPTMAESSSLVQTGLKGAKCPLQPPQIRRHARWVQQVWQELVDSHPLLADWIRKTRLVGYVSGHPQRAELSEAPRQ